MTSDGRRLHRLKAKLEFAGFVKRVKEASASPSLSFLPPSLAMLYTQMWTLRSGGQLYPGLGTFQIAVAVSKGARPTLSKDPSIIPPLLRAMLVAMWDSEPHKRPSAEEVLAVLRDPELAVQVAGFRSRQ